MFSYACENSELFSQQLDEINDRAQLYQIRQVLKTAQDISNQIRCSGDVELQQFSQKMAIGQIANLLTVVNHRIDAVNREEKFLHDDEVSDNVNLILAQIEYEFTRKCSEELTIYNNDLHDREVKVMQEFERNFDQKEPAFVNLIEEFKRFLSEKGIRPKDVSDYKLKIGYMDEVMKKIRQINHANENLKSKYNQDERFVRIHKRIVEENAKRITTKARPIISDKEYVIAEGLNRLKEWIDRMIFFKHDILKNEAAFNQDVLAEVSKKLFEFNITANIDDRKFIQRSIANEYYAQYNQMIFNTQRIY